MRTEGFTDSNLSLTFLLTQKRREGKMGNGKAWNVQGEAESERSRRREEREAERDGKVGK